MGCSEMDVDKTEESPGLSSAQSGGWWAEGPAYKMEKDQQRRTIAT